MVSLPFCPDKQNIGRDTFFVYSQSLQFTALPEGATERSHGWSEAQPVDWIAH